MTRASRLIPLPLVLALTFAAAGQQRGDDLTRSLDEGVEDRGPLSTSLREMHVDLRQPVGFENVYRVGEQDELLMRISGGLHAVFPRSVYAETVFGPLPLTPPGTLFFVGEPDERMLMRLGLGGTEIPLPPEDRSGLRVQARIDEAPLDEEEAGEPVEWNPPPPEHIVFAVQQRSAPPVIELQSAPAATTGTAGRIVSDPTYRRQRLDALMQRAAEAELASGE
jgi:hypothetical protein